MKNGFTLMELLVVVLIIGILAAIALPQYQMAVGKAKFSELKTLTKAVTESLQRYNLEHGTYTDKLQDLDITIPVGDTSCNLHSIDTPYISCARKIFGVSIAYYVLKQNNKPHLCVAWTTDLSHPANVFCAKEAHRITPTNGGNRYTHYY